MKKLYYASIAAAVAAIFMGMFLLEGSFSLSYASASNNVVANVQVGNAIYLNVVPNTINFGSLAPLGIYDANILVADYDVGGNIGANILVDGTGFVNQSNTIGVSNTLWSPTALSTSGGTALSSTFVNTNIYISQPSLSSPSTSNSIYFGVEIPGGAAPGNYLETINFEDENTTYSTYNSIVSAPYNSFVTAKVDVLPTCYISLSTNAISFGSLVPTSNTPTNNVVTDSDPNGNVQASILVSGSTWNSIATPSIGFGTSNTLWSASSQTSYTGNALTSTVTSTGITIAAPNTIDTTTNSPIYFGLAVPAGTPAGTYQQTITIENSC
ncbi:MAG: hypothetical protein ACP5SJ_00880 [Candidatus Micrarchaeia archaeon]